MNNRQLYESIMKNVSKIVKRALMENEYNLDVEQAADIFIDDLKAQNRYDFETELSDTIDMMKNLSGNRKDRTYYKGVPYSLLIPELERRLAEVSQNKDIRESYDQFSDSDFASDGDPYGLVDDYKVTSILDDNDWETLICGNLDDEYEMNRVIKKCKRNGITLDDILNDYMCDKLCTERGCDKSDIEEELADLFYD